MELEQPRGILNLDKPRGSTSHDVVARVRRLIDLKRVGHAGTLDPLATGVLLLCIGQATRVSEYLMHSHKCYRATLRLGIETDTHDADGSEVSRQDPVTVTREELEGALLQFRGAIEQIPPMYSALKRNGQTLHRLARRGVRVDLEPRPVHIFDLQITRWDSNLPVLEMECSPGTYVRALARDLGRLLGCGAHVASLVRTASGEFDVSEATTLAHFERAVTEDRWCSLLHPIDAALADFQRIELSEDQTAKIRHGQPIRNLAPPSTELGRAYSKDGQLVAIVAFDSSLSLWRPRKVFASV